MIHKISRQEIPDCVEVICKSFMTVANEFGFTAFATTEERLLYQLEQEQRTMFTDYENDKTAGYYSLLKQNEKYDFFPFTCRYMKKLL